MKTKLFLAVCLTLLAATAPSADILYFTGHSGLDEGHANIFALHAAQGATVVYVPAGLLPADLSPFSLIYIVMPGFTDASDFFGAGEKAALNAWLTDENHRVVLVGDWDGFYGGQAVMNDLLAAIGNPIVFDPGAYDAGCGHCAGALGDPDPLTAGLTHVCYAFTPTWDPAFGVPLAYPEDGTAPGAWLVSNGTDVPCIVGIGDSNTISDPCGYMLDPGGDADTKTFVRRLYTINCAGDPVSLDSSSWGQVKGLYR